LEPYFTGSHQSWADGYKKHSRHNIFIMSLPGRFWKWRMHGGAVTLAHEFHKLKESFDLILATDMLDLTTFLSLTRSSTSHIPTAIYFHENQLSYPWSPNDRDIIEKRDKQYGFINYTSSLTADRCFFNSDYHRLSFLSELPKLLKHFPDFNEMDTIRKIESKSSVLHLGIDLKRFDKFKTIKNKIPTIVWNHRWEYDKNPDDFFKLLIKMNDEELDFKAVILGENFSKSPSEFKDNINKLGSRILHAGFVNTFQEYAEWLWKSSIVPVTNLQDFFGASIIEAVYCECIPVLPNRLSYPELFPSEVFYKNEKDLYNNTKMLFTNNQYKKPKNYSNIVSKYDWSIMAPKYDAEMEKLVIRS